MQLIHRVKNHFFWYLSPFAIALGIALLMQANRPHIMAEAGPDRVIQSEGTPQASERTTDAQNPAYSR